MYTPFQGEKLLQSYQSSRMAVVQRKAVAKHASVESDLVLVTYAVPILEKLFDATSDAGGMKFRSLIEVGGEKIDWQARIEGNIPKDLARGLGGMSTHVRVTTLDLLHSLIAVQLTIAQDANTKIWLDRLVQRFEVTKKIYEFYLPCFRKGTGDNASVRLYWLLALALSLFYARSNEIKYLSTLLKVCDLLCSLPEELLNEAIPGHGLSVVLAAEILGVQLLAEAKGVSFATE